MSHAPLDPDFDRHATSYDQDLQRGLDLTGEGKEFYAAGRVQWLRKRLADLKVQPHACLDFGCGTGSSATFLRDVLHVGSYMGFDPSVQSVACARVSVTWDEAQFVSREEDVGNEQFDLAFSNGVFHHIDPDMRAEACRVVWRALKPGGWFAFWENNRWNPAVHWVMSRVAFDQDAKMLFPFQAKSLLRTCGFRIVLTDSCFVFPSIVRWLRFLEPALCKVPVGGQYLVLARKVSA